MDHSSVMVSKAGHREQVAVWASPGECGADGRSSLIVKECVPFATPLLHDLPLRIAYITKPDEALSLPWIRRLPGEKRIQFVHGQIFVVQHYLCCKVARAHIYRSQQFHVDPSAKRQVHIDRQASLLTGRPDREDLVEGDDGHGAVAGVAV